MSLFFEKKITVFSIPLPDHALSPNSTKHHRTKAKAKAKAKKSSKEAAENAVYLLGHDWEAWDFPWHRAKCQIIWHKKRNIAIDKDNALAQCKSVIDGLEEAGLIHNDKGLVHLPIHFELDRQNPRLDIEITWIPNEPIWHLIGPNSGILHETSAILVERCAFCGLELPDIRRLLSQLDSFWIQQNNNGSFELRKTNRNSNYYTLELKDVPPKSCMRLKMPYEIIRKEVKDGCRDVC